MRYALCIGSALVSMMVLPQISAQDRPKFNLDKAKEKFEQAEKAAETAIDKILEDESDKPSDERPEDDKVNDEKPTDKAPQKPDNNDAIPSDNIIIQAELTKPNKAPPNITPADKAPNIENADVSEAKLNDLSPLQMRYSDIPQYVPGQILFFSNASKAQLQNIANDNGISIADIMALDQIGVSMALGTIQPNDSVTSAQARLENENAILWAQPNHYFQLMGQTSRGKGLELHNIKPRPTLSGTILMIDSAVDIGHESLRGANITQQRFGSDGRPDPHGTAIAELLVGEGQYAGVAQNSKLISLAAFMPHKKNLWLSQTLYLAMALNEAARLRPNVINLSFGAKSDDEIITALLNTIEKKGICVMAAAGNGGNILFPARHPKTLSITAVDSQKNIYEYASKGPQIDVAAWGVSMNAAVPNGRRLVSGTSFATAIVSGSLLQMAACNGDYNPSKMRQLVTSNAQDLGDKGHDDIYGNGLFQLSASSNGQIASPAIANVQPRSANHYFWAAAAMIAFVILAFLIFFFLRRGRKKDIDSQSIN